jgi:hypothetical protein
MFESPGTSRAPFAPASSAGAGRVVVLVEDLAHDLLEQVLHGHHARGAAVLVEHDREMLLAPLEVGEHLLHLA